MPVLAAFFLCIGLLFSALPAGANEPVELVIKDHKFTPETLNLPAEQKATLIVKNQDASAEEFESHDLKIEKIVPANGEIKVVIKPLKPGTYHFVGEFHEATAKGTIVVQ